uniref:RING-type E3 ubiquitin transferase n=2 Tax=Ciona intestinalis TaxID=7719 RepID=H2XZU9_CIOIN
MALGSPDVVTQIVSVRKDTQYINWLKGLVNESAHNVLGPRLSTVCSEIINHVSEFLFYFLTTGGNLQTLGEEYTGMIQVDHTERHTPSLLRRLALISLYSISPYLLNKVSLQFINYLNKYKKVQIITQDTNPEITKLLKLLVRLHFCLFYMNGIYYSIPKHLLGIKYLSYSHHKSQTGQNFANLGRLSMLETLMSVCLLMFNWYKKKQNLNLIP